MNKVININFQGRILPIEELAYESLKQYIESLRAYFEQEEGKDEIINDIECRVAELCEDRLKKGAVCITEEDIELIISSIGRPADFESIDGFETTGNSDSSTKNSNRYSKNASFNSAAPNNEKRLYRDEQNKVLGGVCSGIANYFNVEPLLVRILWIFLIGINILGYLILWIAVPSTSVKEIGSPRKRLFRDIDNKIVGGVCSGLSKYFGIKVWIIRILFLIPFIRFIFNFNHLHLFQFWEFPDFPNFIDLTFSPGALFVYVVLWLVLPEAKTSADKLEMVGEKVDINSIKNTIQGDMEGFSKRAQGWGSEFYKKNKNTSSSNKENDPSSNDTNLSTNEDDSIPQNRGDDSFISNQPLENKKGIIYFVGKVITICIKAFVYFILAIVGVALLAALFGIGVAATSLLPLKKFILEDGAQSTFAIATILFFIWVPVLGIVTAVIRKIAGYKKSNIWVRSSFWAIWGLGWVMLILFFTSLGKSFSKHNKPVEQTLFLNNAKINFLEVTAAPKMKYYEDRWFQISPFSEYGDEDSLFVRNLQIRIVQSKTDSFEVKVVKLSNGKTVAQANELAGKINFSITQQDSLVYLDKGIGINANDKFRNQHIIMSIAVPVGKRIKISNRGWSQRNIRINRHGLRTETIDRISSDENWYNEWNESWDNESYGFERGVEYLMTENGLEKLSRSNEDNVDAQDEYQNGNEDDMEKQLNDLKNERQRLKAELKNEKDQQDERRNRKKNDLKESTNHTSMLSPLNDVKTLGTKLEELQVLIARFHY